MNKLVKNLWVLFTLALVGIVANACHDNDDDTETAANVTGTWIMVDQKFVEEDGSEQPGMMQSQEWYFGDDGVQYVINDGYVANDKYTYTINGKKLILTPNNTTLNTEEFEIVKVENNTMVLTMKDPYGGNGYIKYTFSLKK